MAVAAGSRLTLARALATFEAMAPVSLAEKWDNVGLLIDPMIEEWDSPPTIFLTNDLTEKVLNEAIAAGSNIIYTYHPTPFRGMKKFTRKSPAARIVLTCARKQIAVYSPHTAMDSVVGGVNDWLIGGLGVTAAEPLAPSTTHEGAGLGRRGAFEEPVTLAALVERVKAHLRLDHVRIALSFNDLPGDSSEESLAQALATTAVSSVAVCAGSGVSVLQGDRSAVWLTGEMSHHEVLAANAAGTTVILTDHSNTERGFLPLLAERMRQQFSDDAVAAQVLVSAVDADPLNVV